MLQHFLPALSIAVAGRPAVLFYACAEGECMRRHGQKMLTIAKLDEDDDSANATSKTLLLIQAPN